MSTKESNVETISDLSEQSSSKGKASTDDANAPGALPFKPAVGNPMKRVIDETKLSPEEADKLMKRRAYNRESATRARKRTKHLVEQLQNELAQEKQEKEELLKKNEELQARLALFEKHNQSLLLKQLITERRQASMAAAAAFLPGTGMPLGGLSSGIPSANSMFAGLGPQGF